SRRWARRRYSTSPRRVGRRSRRWKTSMTRTATVTRGVAVGPRRRTLVLKIIGWQNFLKSVPPARPATGRSARSSPITTASRTRCWAATLVRSVLSIRCRPLLATSWSTVSLHCAIGRSPKAATAPSCAARIILDTRVAGRATLPRRSPMIPADCRGLVEQVAELARTRFAPRAARFDAEAAFPIENYRDLHAAGLLGLTVPRGFGGVGADPLTYALCLVELAKGCSATARTL